MWKEIEVPTERIKAFLREKHPRLWERIQIYGINIKYYADYKWKNSRHIEYEIWVRLDNTKDVVFEFHEFLYRGVLSMRLYRIGISGGYAQKWLRRVLKLMGIKKRVKDTAFYIEFEYEEEKGGEI